MHPLIIIITLNTLKYSFSQQSKSVTGFELINEGLPYGKSTSLTILSNTPKKGISLMLDPICLQKFHNGQFNEIQLRRVLEYQCCKHVLYCPFTGGHKNFLLYTRHGSGRPIKGYPCPFHDGGVALHTQANYVPL